MFKKLCLYFCLLVIFSCFSNVVLADLPLADGGATGQWFNSERDGEGIFLEIVDSGEGGRSVAISWFTYDQFGEQMWLTGSAEIGEDAKVVSIQVFVTSGPIFGPTYNMDDLNLETWGTIEVLFQTCSQGNMTYTSSVFGTGSIALTRLTNVVNVNCVEPPVDTLAVTPGMWSGVGVCFNVAADGLSVTSEGSTCAGGVAFTATLPGTKVGSNQNCTVNVICPDDYAIYSTGDDDFPQPAFDCRNLGGAASGAFYENAEGPIVNGPLYERSGGDGCVGIFVATPEG